MIADGMPQMEEVRKHVLRKNVAGKMPTIDITKEQYEGYKRAREVLANCLAIEEQYEIVVASYIEFEKEMLESAISHMVRTPPGYAGLLRVRVGLNIRLMNLLTAVRLYLDQLSGNVRRCLHGVRNIKRDIDRLRHNEYDNNPEYAFMETLRNYAQHCGTPIQWIQYGVRRTSANADGLLVYHLEVASLRSTMEKHTKFRNHSALRRLDEKIDLKSATRCYVECISNVHFAARGMVTSAADASRGLLMDAHKQYSEVYEGDLVGLSACEYSGRKQISSVPLLLDWDDVRLELTQRNRRLTNLRKRFPTGQINAKKE
jgi:hypothetical protein